jgi:site-specific DNA-cytosine methylase
MEMININLLELFAGSRSIGKVGDSLGFNVFSIDWREYEGINLAIDIGYLIKEDVPFVPDAVWASPDCTTYSIAACGTHRINSKRLVKD